MSAPWAGLAKEIVGVQKACVNLGTPGALAEYVYNRCCAYEGLASHQEVAEPLIGTAIEHWKPPESADESAAPTGAPWRGAPIGGPVEHALRQHARLYRKSVAFKMAVDTLIPLLVDALAMKAERDWADQEQLVRTIMESTGRPLLPEEWLDDDFDLSTGQPK